MNKAITDLVFALSPFNINENAYKNFCNFFRLVLEPKKFFSIRRINFCSPKMGGK